MAVRLVVEKEEERQAFHVAEYFDVEALLVSRDLHFTARLQAVDGVRLAGRQGIRSGHRPAPAAGRAPASERGSGCRAGADGQDDAALARGGCHPQGSHACVPAPPFTTSTLQQAASGRLRMSPQRVMRIAQRLYEGVSVGGGVREWSDHLHEGPTR